jgi:uncharacterized damage-inducible protein DinB
MRALPGVLLFCLLTSAGLALGQENPATAPAVSPPAAASPANPLSSHNRVVWGGVKHIILGSAEKMAEENFSFRPTPEVRSFGQILGHVADAQYLFCSRVLGEKNPAPGVEKTKTSKADLIAALKAAFAYCDRAYEAMTDASATEVVNLMGGDTPKLSALAVNSLHTTEHYGNLVTYLRMKNIVPPSSEAGFIPQRKK